MSINPKYSWPNVKHFFARTLWEMDLSLVPWWNAWPLHLMRIVLAVVRDLADGQLNLRAMSLVYTTLLSLVPLLAISFSVLKGFGVLLPYFLIVAAFSFIYVFMPNTRVHLSSAVVGALVAGFLWKVVGWIFSSFVVGSANYTAVYSGFATLILFFIWLYVGWLILLVGASISFYHQNPEYLATRRGPPRLGNAFKEKMGLLVMYLVGHNYYRGGPEWSMEALSQRLRVPGTALEVVVMALEECGLLKRTKDEPSTFLPAKPMETTSVKEVLDAIRLTDVNANLSVAILPREEGVEGIVDEVQNALDNALRGRTLKELALSGPDAIEELIPAAESDAAD